MVVQIGSDGDYIVIQVVKQDDTAITHEAGVIEFDDGQGPPVRLLGLSAADLRDLAAASLAAAEYPQ